MSNTPADGTNQVMTLVQLESEIKGYQSVGGQAIYEIGRRIAYVKQHNLQHGEFGTWLERMQIDHTFAKRTMRVAEEFPNGATLPDLGASALYLLATIPEDERDVEHQTSKGESKLPEDMSVRELEQLRKQLRESDTERASLLAENEELRNQEPVVAEPDDYQKLKNEHEFLKKRNHSLQQQLDDIEEEQDELDGQSSEYERLNQKIAQLTGKMDSTKLKADAAAHMIDLRDLVTSLLTQVAPELYRQDFAQFTYGDPAMQTLRTLLDQVTRWSADMRAAMPANIKEGEIING